MVALASWGVAVTRSTGLTRSTRRTGTPWPDLGWLRDELGLQRDQLAA